MHRFALVAALTLAAFLPAQGGSFRNLSWNGWASIIDYNGRPAFALCGFWPPSTFITSSGTAVDLKLLELAIWDDRSCVIHSTPYLHEVSSFDVYYIAKMPPMQRIGLSIMRPVESTWFPDSPVAYNEIYGICYCNLWDPPAMNYLGPCGEGNRCGGTYPQMWAAVFDVRFNR